MIERDRRGEAVPRPRATHRVAPTNEATGDGKSISISPTGTMNVVTDLAATVNLASSQATVTWTEVLPGDYDNNGVVDIGDLIPLALYYGQRTDSGPDDAHRLVNGDADPEINIWDLGAIAANYGAHIQGYQVWRGHWNGSSTDWGTAFLPNVANPFHSAFSIDRPTPPPVSTRPAYTYTDDISGVADKNNIRYKVTAFGDGAPGAESNEAAVPATTFSVSGKVTVLGNPLAGVTLTLAPGGLHATTQADGSYEISGVVNGAYALTPTGTGYVFAPSSVPVTVDSANVIGLDFAATGGLANSAWPKFRGNARNTGQSPYIGAQTNRVKWTFESGQRYLGSPSVDADGTVYFGSQSGKVYAVNPANGIAKWVSQPSGTVVAVYTTPAIAADGTMYIGSQDGRLYAINSADGTVKWSFQTLDYLGSSPAIAEDGTIYVGSSDDKVYALNPADGSPKWKYATGGSVYSSPAIAEDGTVYVGSWDHNVYALSPADGSVKWTSTTGSYVDSSPAIGADGTVYIGSDDYSMYALNPADGALKWVHATPNALGGPPAIAADGTVYVGCLDNNVYALSPFGSIKWSYTTGGGVYGSPAVGADGTVYLGSSDGNVYAFDPSNGQPKWTYTTGDSISSSPAIGADGTVYVGTDNGKFYAFSGEGGRTYRVSGRLTVLGKALAKATVTLSPGERTCASQVDGTYSFPGVAEGTYTITPRATGFIFTPPARTVTVSSLNVAAQDFSAIGGLADSAWPKFRGNAQNTGQSPYVGAQTDHLKWSCQTTNSVYSSPVIGADGTVYIGNDDGYLYQLSPEDGAVVGRRSTGYSNQYPLRASVAIGVDGTVCVADGEGLMFGIASPQGWAYDDGNPFLSSPTIASDGTVYVGCTDNKLIAINQPDGTLVWSRPTSSDVVSSPAIGLDGTIFFGSTDHDVYALSPLDGSMKWTHWAGAIVTSSPAIGPDGTVYVGCEVGTVYALNGSDGTVRWTATTGGGDESSPAVGEDGTAYIGSGDGGVYALNSTDGSIGWRYFTGGPVYSSPAVGADGTVYVGSGDHAIYALNGADGSVKWSYTTGGVVDSSPAIGADGTVYVGSSDGKVYAFGS